VGGRHGLGGMTGRRKEREGRKRKTNERERPQEEGRREKALAVTFFVRLYHRQDQTFTLQGARRRNDVLRGGRVMGMEGDGFGGGCSTPGLRARPIINRQTRWHRKLRSLQGPIPAFLPTGRSPEVSSLYRHVPPCTQRGMLRFLQLRYLPPFYPS